MSQMTGLAERPLTQSLLGWKRGSDGMKEKEREVTVVRRSHFFCWDP